MKVQLILEGGGARGAYTAGVLDLFIEKGLRFLNVIGVSAGAYNAVSYKSWQYKRNFEIITKFADDKRYCGIRPLLRHGNIFGFDFIFKVIAKELLPFDYEAFVQSPIAIEAVVTNIITGCPEYYPIADLERDLPYLRASCSIPGLSRIVTYQGKKMLDGSITDSIPVKRSIEFGYDRQVVVLTRAAGYRKKRIRSMRMIRIRYPRFPRLAAALRNRYVRYNQTLDLIGALEAENRAFVIRPDRVEIGRFEKDKDKLLTLYEQGYRDAAARYDALLAFVSGAENVITV